MLLAGAPMAPAMFEAGAPMQPTIEATPLEERPLPASTYADAEIQALYDSWLAQGSASLKDAYAVGVELETADIADLEDAIDESGNASLDATYQNLLDASRNHLSAFQRASSGGGMGGGGMGGGFRWRGGWG